MAVWRYTYTTKLPPGAHTRLWPIMPPSRQEGLDGLEEFLAKRKEDYGDELLPVALEESQVETSYRNAHVEWQEVKTLVARSER